MISLKQIVKNIEINNLIGNDEAMINGFAMDSRSVKKGYLFIAVKGTQVDGHHFINDAIEKGAKGIMCQKEPEKINESITYIMVNDTAAIAGIVAGNYYGNPSSELKLVGITGTNGKTTIATLLYRLARHAGYKAGLISTIHYYVEDIKYEATHTTPDTIKINKLLRDMVEEGCTYCFMEVSSHAIDQKRTIGLQFSGAVFTNLSHDHLDYHLSFDEYLKVKKRLFDGLPSSAFALANIDDKNGHVMLQNTVANKKTYALKTMADFNCKIIEQQMAGMQLQIESKDVWTHFIGEFNAYNLLAVYAVALLLNFEKEEILKAISVSRPVNGRFEYMISKEGVTAIVDYAHTPDALLNVLLTINKLAGTGQRIITVVGAGGNRDKKKRPVMAKIAVEKSDQVILTSDNPRNEEPEAILRDMKAGIKNHQNKQVMMIPDRFEAIKIACNLAEKGDIILVAGKGHETYQEIKGVKHHFDDKEVLSELLNIT